MLQKGIEIFRSAINKTISYLSVYENREKVKRLACWLLIISIALVPHICPKQYDITSVLKSPQELGRVISMDNRNIVKDEEMTVTDAHTVVLKYMYDYFRDYQVSRFIYRNGDIMMWVFNSNGYGTYDDIKKIGDLLKIRFPNTNIVVVLVRSNGSMYAVSEYRI